MIILEFLSEVSHDKLVKDEKFEEISNGKIVALLLAECIDEWIYDVECAEERFKASYKEYKELMRRLIKRYAGELAAAVLSLRTARFLGKEVIALYEEPGDLLNDIYCIYISDEKAISRSTIVKIVLLSMKARIWDMSLPIELTLGVESLDDVANKLSKLSFEVTRGYAREGDILAERLKASQSLERVMHILHS